MNSGTIQTLKALLVSAYPNDYQNYYYYYSFAIAEKLEQINITDPPSFPHLFSKNRWMEKIHYSWFLPFFEELSQTMQSYYFTLIPDEGKKELMELLHNKNESSPPKILKTYLLNILFKYLHLENILPIDLLPSSEVNAILKLSKKKIILLIDLLGIHDLAYEMKQIVDKTLLKKIQGALNREETLFLDYASKQPIKWIPPKLNLLGWDGDVKRLKTLLHYRGITRLAQATFQEDDNFKWHLSHQLDIGRGKALMKLFSGKYDPAMIPYFKGQIFDIIKRLDK